MTGQTTNGGIDLLAVVMHEMGHLLGYGHSADAHDLMAPVLSAGGSSAGSSAEAVEPLGQAQWRSGPWSLAPRSASPLDDVFADLGDDSASQDSADGTSPLLESRGDDLLAVATARPSEEATQARVPRRSRLQRYEREVDAWFDGLAREAGESADLPTGEQS